MTEVTRPLTSIFLFDANEQISEVGALPTRNSFAFGTSFRMSGKISLQKYSAASTFGSYAKLPTKRIEGELSLITECLKLLDNNVVGASTIFFRWSLPSGIILTSIVGSSRSMVILSSLVSAIHTVARFHINCSHFRVLIYSDQKFDFSSSVTATMNRCRANKCSMLCSVRRIGTSSLVGRCCRR